MQFLVLAVLIWLDMNICNHDIEWLHATRIDGLVEKCGWFDVGVDKKLNMRNKKLLKKWGKELKFALYVYSRLLPVVTLIIKHKKSWNETILHKAMKKRNFEYMHDERGSYYQLGSLRLRLFAFKLSVCGDYTTYIFVVG
jgi:hypothetical protein